ncbi:MAG: hypothetical protein ACYS5V_02070 [Planctomycetota bacterium]|jgi:hypothetical protein
MRHTLAVVTLAAVIPFGCSFVDEPAGPAMARVELATIPAERLAGRGEVSEPTRVGGVRCRVVKAGRAVAFDVPRWWGKTAQPAEGTMYLAGVRYKDTAGKPIRFLSWAGLGRYEGPTEMHRFGGLGDGKWKIALVPLAWDMLLSLPSQKGLVRLGLGSADGDVPVASITITGADGEAEARYNAETRDWVRRVQSGVAVASVKPRTPVLPKALAGKPLVPYVRSYMSVIGPYSAPQAGETGVPLKATMATNEFEPAPFAVYAGAKLTGVTFEVGPMTGPAGTLDVEIARGTLEYTRHRPGSRGKAFTHAQRIWPMHPVDIDKGRSHWFWITLKTDPARSKPGKYSGSVTIRAAEATASLPIEVEVLPIKLLTMDEAGLLMGGCTAGLVPAHEMPVLRDHNFNMINIWYPGVRPRMKIVDKKLQLDFEQIDYWMALARKHDMGPLVWFIGGDSHRYPRTLSIERQIYIALHDGEKPFKELYNDFTRLAGLPENRGRPLEEVEPYYRQWISRVWNHAKDNSWPEIIFTPFDEPAVWARPAREPKPGQDPPILGGGPWVRDHFKYACKLIHESAPGARVYASIHHNNLKPKAPGWASREGEVFIPDVDVFCTNAIDEDRKLGEKVRAAGKAFWQYRGIGAGNRPDEARYTHGFFFSAFDSRGSLLWAYDWGPGLDTSGSANWMIAWRTPFDVICSPYFEAKREAGDDRRYVETLKALAKRKKVDVSPFLAKLHAEAIALRGMWGPNVVYDQFDRATDLETIDGMRRRVIQKILELQRR